MGSGDTPHTKRAIPHTKWALGGRGGGGIPHTKWALGGEGWWRYTTYKVGSRGGGVVAVYHIQSGL